MEPEIREGDWVVVDLASPLPEAGGAFLIRARGEPGGQTSRGGTRRWSRGGRTPEAPAHLRRQRPRPQPRRRRPYPQQGVVGGAAGGADGTPAPSSRMMLRSLCPHIGSGAIAGASGQEMFPLTDRTSMPYARLETLGYFHRL